MDLEANTDRLRYWKKILKINEKNNKIGKTVFQGYGDWQSYLYKFASFEKTYEDVRNVLIRESFYFKEGSVRRR